MRILLLIGVVGMAGCCGDDIGCSPLLKVTLGTAPTAQVTVGLLLDGVLVEEHTCSSVAQCGSGLDFFGVHDRMLSATLRVSAGGSSSELSRDLEWRTVGTARGNPCAECRVATVVVPVP